VGGATKAEVGLAKLTSINKICSVPNLQELPNCRMRHIAQSATLPRNADASVCPFCQNCKTAEDDSLLILPDCSKCKICSVPNLQEALLPILQGSPK
jgi:hypothetical protein